jgi:hypothetical protein
MARKVAIGKTVSSAAKKDCAYAVGEANGWMSSDIARLVTVFWLRKERSRRRRGRNDL